jgi:hypothetical protein
MYEHRLLSGYLYSSYFVLAEGGAAILFAVIMIMWQSSYNFSYHDHVTIFLQKQAYCLEWYQ